MPSEYDAHGIRRWDTPIMQSEVASIRSSIAPLLGESKPSSETTATKWGRDRDKARRSRFQGWRVGVTICASTAATVLLANICLTVWASTKNGLSNGFGTIHDGSCQKTKDLSRWLHFAINVLSTILLSASNYCMQCLASPTREEVDRAHSRHIWLDIGVPSVRNLRSIARRRIVLWCLLAISGIPLHLLYNSAIFSTLASQEYNVYIASDELTSQNAINWTAAGIPQDPSHWQNLTNQDCIQAYGTDFVTAHSDVVAVSSNVNVSELQNPIYAGVGVEINETPYSWMCSYSDCDTDGLPKDPSDWELYEYDPYGHSNGPWSVQYCLSKPTDEHCRLQLSPIIMCIVMLCNIVKGLCMCLILWHQGSPPLVTLGDAIESFLQNRDMATVDMCLASKRDFTQLKWDGSTERYLRKSHHWFSSASLKRWLTCNLLCISTLIVAGGLLVLGVNNDQLLSKNLSHLWSLGFGTVTPELLLGWNWSGSGGLMIAVLLANSPQVILSFLFLTYNGLYTCMLMADEWSDYAHERKSLRVTDPMGDQRSTYRLQLPYKYGIPLTILSGTLHWLVSLSLFLARVQYYGEDGTEDQAQSISTVGYSCIAIITVIILGAVVITIGILNGFRKYRPGMPLVGSCSAAISAACHPPREDVDAATLPLLWGAVSGQEEGDVGHCCFTSFEASVPVEGKLYAG